MPGSQSSLGWTRRAIHRVLGVCAVNRQPKSRLRCRSKRVPCIRGSAPGMPRTGIGSSCCQPRIDRTARCRLVGCWLGARSSSLRPRNCKPSLRGRRGLCFAPSLQKASARKSSVASAVPWKFIRPQLPAVLLNRDRASAHRLGLYHMKGGRGNPSRKYSGERQDTAGRRIGNL